MAKKNKQPAPVLVDAKTQAQWFGRVRHVRQKETAEDYVELIADLIAVQKEARLSDVAARMGVSHPTASKVINRLMLEGYVLTEPYRALFLTEKGQELAEKCKERHRIVLAFLMKLGVPEAVAEFDAEGIEHHISKETLALFKAFITED